jgi:hypothetical protein
VRQEPDPVIGRSRRGAVTPPQWWLAHALVRQLAAGRRNSWLTRGGCPKRCRFASSVQRKIDSRLRGNDDARVFSRPRSVIPAQGLSVQHLLGHERTLMPRGGHHTRRALPSRSATTVCSVLHIYSSFRGEILTEKSLFSDSAVSAKADWAVRLVMPDHSAQKEALIVLQEPGAMPTCGRHLWPAACSNPCWSITSSGLSLRSPLLPWWEL